MKKLKKNKNRLNGRKPVYSSKDLDIALRVIAREYNTDLKFVKKWYTQYKRKHKKRTRIKAVANDFTNYYSSHKITPYNIKNRAKDIAKRLEMTQEHFKKFSEKYGRFYNRKDYEKLGKVIRNSLNKTPSDVGDFSKYRKMSDLKLGIIASYWENLHNKMVANLPYQEYGREEVEKEEDYAFGGDRFTLREENTRKMLEDIDNILKNKKDIINELEKEFKQ